MSYFHYVKVYNVLTIIRNDENSYFLFLSILQIFENKINVAFIVISIKI